MVAPSAGFTGPRHYDEALGPVQFDPFARALVERVPRGFRGPVLELACGTGIVTRRLRARIDPGARLVATDLAPAMIEYARSRDPAGAVEWREADAMRMPFEDATFDLVACGFGVMFFPDPAAGLREARMACVRDLQTIVLPGNHHMHLEDPAPVARAIHAFLAR